MHQEESVIVSDADFFCGTGASPVFSSTRKHGRGAHATNRGFTLIELLVTIGIILLLIGILIPTVSKMRKTAQAADSQSFVTQLQGAIEQYHQTFRAYPGPLTNDQVYVDPAAFPLPFFTRLVTDTNGVAGFDVSMTTTATATVARISMSENLVLGLLGGLRAREAPPASGTFELVYDPTVTTSGGGPNSLNPANPKRYPAFLTAGNLSMRLVGGLQTGNFGDAAGSAHDSIIPEFVDRFSNPMPILYLRAKAGGGGATPPTATNNPIITSLNPPFLRLSQYDLSQIISYTGTYDTGGALVAGNPPGSGTSIGMGKEVDEYQIDGAPKSKDKLVSVYHGLRTVNTAATLGPVGNLNYQYPFDGYPYFTSSTGTARQKDGYILISAGKDRTYGTEDDITNFGSVAP